RDRAEAEGEAELEVARREHTGCGPLRRVELDREPAGRRPLVRRGQRRRRIDPAVQRRRRETVEQKPPERRFERAAQERSGDVRRDEDGPDRRDSAARRHAAIRIAAIGAVANRGGHTTARTRGRTHSQITLIARRLAPGSGLPGGANASPLPFGSDPTGSRGPSAVVATPLGVIDAVAGGTTWDNAPAGASPPRAPAPLSAPHPAPH